MNPKPLCLPLVFLVVLSGCVSVNRIRPIVDIQASPASGSRSYEADLVECQNYAANIDTGEAAVGGAIVGAVLLGALGAAAGAVGGNAGLGAGIGAAAGGVDGLASGIAAAEGRKREIVIRCLAGRGWNVL